MNTNSSAPLAERMRPKSLQDYIGQTHLLNKGSVLNNALSSGFIPSIILWGPPGVGKTTLANIISNTLKRPFYSLSAINSGVKDIREIIDKANNQGLYSGKSPILFIDEIHRFSKSQQDSLLGAVEKGQVTLIGATTENPSFEVIPALLSRCQVYVLQHLSKEELISLIHLAQNKDSFIKEKEVIVKEYEALLRLSGGDGRRLLNTFELIVASFKEPGGIVTNEYVLQQVQQKSALYDKAGEQHYDIISAFIKSIRGSDPNAAVYWMARMIEGGEDPLFICRRMIILSSEDIGNANPNALLLATNCFNAVEKVGMPEGRIIMSQTAIYLSTSPKSNASYIAIDDATAKIKITGDLPVPITIRNAPTQLMKDLDYGKDYKYAHQYNNNFVLMEFLPDEIKGTSFYNPGNNTREIEIRQFLRDRWGSKYNY
jgi:putative ATPase